MKYKLLKELPNHKAGKIGTKRYWEQWFVKHNFSKLRLQDEKWFEKVEPLFYCEDFPDRSFPKKSCENCFYNEVSNNSNRCLTCKHKQTSKGIVDYLDWDKSDNWAGELKGRPIYEGNRCWYASLYHCRLETVIKGDVPEITGKYFANKNNAREYHNKLKWQDKLKFKIGDIIIPIWENVTAKITGIDFSNENYSIQFKNSGEISVLTFNTQHKWKINKQPTFKVGDWVMSNVTDYAKAWQIKKIGIDNFGNTLLYSKHNYFTRSTDVKLATDEEIKKTNKKSKFKVGDWVYAKKSNNDFRKAEFIPIFKIEEISIQGGTSIWLRPTKGRSYGVKEQYCRFATDKEIKKATYKFTTHDNIKKYIGDKWIPVDTDCLKILDIQTIGNNIDEWNHSDIIAFDKLKNAQQYLAKQIAAKQTAAKRGFEVGADVFNKVSKKYHGKIIKIIQAADIDHIQLWVSDSMWVELDDVISFEELIKEEGLKIGTRIPGRLIYEWVEYYKTYEGKIVFENELDTKVICFVVKNKIPVFIIKNGRSVKLIGFKAFKEKWEKEYTNKSSKWLADSFQVLEIKQEHFKTGMTPIDPKGKIFHTKKAALLHHARLKYYIGTKFKSLGYGNNVEVFDINHYWKDNDILNSDGIGIIYRNGKWAEIISKPVVKMDSYEYELLSFESKNQNKTSLNYPYSTTNIFNIDEPIDLSEIERVCIVDENGRSYDNCNCHNIYLDVQNKTLKISINTKK